MVRHLPQLPLAAAFQKQMLCSRPTPSLSTGSLSAGLPPGGGRPGPGAAGRGGRGGSRSRGAEAETWHLPEMRVGGGARGRLWGGLPGCISTFPQQPTTRVGPEEGAGSCWGGQCGGPACGFGAGQAPTSTLWSEPRLLPENLCLQACHVSWQLSPAPHVPGGAHQRERCLQ